MKEYTYPPIFRFIYKFGNIPVTIILALYLIQAVIFVDENLLYLIPVAINFLLIYFLNKYYIMLYQIIPYKIRMEGDNLIGSGFLFRKKEVVINLKNVDDLTGGIFNGRLSGLMKVCDSNNQLCIGFYNKIRHAKELETLILSRVRKDIYDKIVERLGLNKEK